MTAKAKKNIKGGIEILKDAIKQIKASKYSMTRGIYFEGEVELEYEDGKSKPPNTQLQPILKKLLKEENCEVCAKGALMISKVCKFNDLEIKSFDAITNGNCRLTGLNQYFDTDTLDTAESIFEREFTSYCSKNNKLASYWLRQSFEKYKDANDCAIAIFQHLIKNKCKFNIPNERAIIAQIKNSTEFKKELKSFIKEQKEDLKEHIDHLLETETSYDYY